ncbi:MAG: proline--tRNA ligase, partial [Verrucomicrobiota bacterium]
EEVVTDYAGTVVKSYKQLPVTFFQQHTKFRDEIRPRFGLMRAKEFIMKDAYSFDVNDELAQGSYQKMYDAYTRIFQRCGLKAFPVEADTGVMGGKFSHEFMVPAETGENEVVYCEACGYAANIEKAQSRVKESEIRNQESGVDKFATPNLKSIDSLAKAMNIPAEQQIKTLVYIVEEKPVLILLRGDHQLNEAKLVSTIGTATFRAATADEIFAALKAYPGSLGGVGVTEFSIYADEILRGANSMVTGANENGFHLRNVSMERDVTVKQFADLRLVQAGETCVKCGAPLKIRRAIEVGHVFKLGTKYSEALKAFFLDESGKQQPSFMGCYGIGVTRTMQAVIEQSNDKDGIIWPLSVAPYQVCLTPLAVANDSAVMQLAEKIYAELSAQNIDVILDDRDDRPGVKFKDADLVGFPIRLAIGEKSLAKGEVELKRRGGELTLVKVDEAVAKILELIKSL